jgi:FkbM family methyltransferase
MIDDGKMIAVHAGGRGNLGNTAVLYQLRENLQIYVVEAVMGEVERWGRFEQAMKKMDEKHGCDIELVQGCLSDGVRDIDFNVMEDARASSVYEIDDNAVDYIRWGSSKTQTLFSWVEACKVDRQIPLRTTTLDILCAEGLPNPHLLTMDIQGSDYAALVGAQTLLESDDLLCVIAEAPLRPIYKGQGTYSDIDILLRRHNFQFAEFVTHQVWWEGIIVGKGFLGVTETMWFRNWRYVRKAENLVRLALLAYMFQHSWYAYQAARRVIDTFPRAVDVFNEEQWPLWLRLLDLQRQMRGPVNDFQARVYATGGKREWSS